MLELEREDDDEGRNASQDVKRLKIDLTKQWDTEEIRCLIQELENQVHTTKSGMRTIDQEGQAARIINDDEGISSKHWSRLSENMYFGEIGNRPLLGKHIRQVFQPSQGASSMTEEGSELSPPSFSRTKKRTRTSKFPNEGVEANTVRSVSPTTVAHFPVVKIMVIGMFRLCMRVSLFVSLPRFAFLFLSIAPIDASVSNCDAAAQFFQDCIPDTVPSKVLVLKSLSRALSTLEQFQPHLVFFSLDQVHDVSVFSHIKSKLSRHSKMIEMKTNTATVAAQQQRQRIDFHVDDTLLKPFRKSQFQEKIMFHVTSLRIPESNTKSAFKAILDADVLRIFTMNRKTSASWAGNRGNHVPLRPPPLAPYGIIQPHCTLPFRQPSPMVYTSS